MDTNNHFNFPGLSSVPTASGLKPTPSSGDSLYTNGAALSFPPQGKSKCHSTPGHPASPPPGCGDGVRPRYGALGSAVSVCSAGQRRPDVPSWFRVLGTRREPRPRSLRSIPAVLGGPRAAGVGVNLGGLLRPRGGWGLEGSLHTPGRFGLEKSGQAGPGAVRGFGRPADPCAALPGTRLIPRLLLLTAPRGRFLHARREQPAPCSDAGAGAGRGTSSGCPQALSSGLDVGKSLLCL